MNWIFIYSILPKLWRLFCWNFEIWAVQKYVHLVDLVKSFPTNIYLQNLASIQPRTSLSKFGEIFKWINYSIAPNFRRSVLGCIDSSDSNQILIFFQDFRDLQDFHTFAPLRSQNFSKKKRPNFSGMKMDFFRVFRWKLRFFCEILMKLTWNLTEMFRKWQTVSRSWEEVSEKFGQC